MSTENEQEAPARGGSVFSEGLGPVGWRYVPSDVWGDQVLTQDQSAADLARQYGRDVEALYTQAQLLAAVEAEHQRCQPNGLMFDALGEPCTRHVRVTLGGNHCVMTPVEGDRYVQDARGAGDDSLYVVADVWLSEREFEDLPEHDGF